ncbi:hypothetical protein BSP109_03166 [Brevibacterium sp. Mu109]|uniref:hypothetical protein n=1 Tax=Brevibacterium sp. Mu109 TaxID=1255669 RepID=UPI000C64449C|nr:hypothetical protein [Brevibacterium sp. Mu109]SMX99730.1 hypothetical protein BSP109_03166 [Brevibacterium sp. Mu109]
MKSEPIDPRHGESEVPNPRYWVIFWGEAGSSDEWELVDCEVDEALRWAEDRAEGRTYGLWAVFDEGTRVATVRLKGTDPNET